MNEDKKKAVQLLKTARGQMDGIIKMIEDERYCIDISNQIMAAGALVKKANKHILAQHLESCVMKSFDDEKAKEEKVEELSKIIGKLLDNK